MKNILELFKVSISLLALTGCGSTEQSKDFQGSRPDYAGSNLSISDGLIRPEVKEAMKLFSRNEQFGENLPAAMTYLKRIEGQFEELYATSKNELERDFLWMTLDNVKRLRMTIGAKSQEEAKQVVLEIVPKVASRQKEFFGKYIQTKELKELMISMVSLMSERSELEIHPEKVNERKLYEAKLTSISNAMLKLYHSPTLSLKAAAEFSTLDQLGILTKENLRDFEKLQPPTKPLSVPNLSENVSLLGARHGGSSVDFSQVMINGVSGVNTHIALPLYIHIKGVINGSQDIKDLTSIAVYRVKDTLLGLIHGYTNTSNDPLSSIHQEETSAVLSQSFGKVYIEGQAGFVNSILNHRAINGSRYQLATGYDFNGLTLFAQTAYRGFKHKNEYCATVGLEFDVIDILMDGFRVSGHTTIKYGYHSFKGLVGSLEGSCAVTFNNGVNISAGVCVSEEEDMIARMTFYLLK